MRIDPTNGLSTTPVGGAKPGAAAAAPASTPENSGTTESGNATSSATTFTPTPNLQSYLSQLKAQPDVRTDAVQEVSSRVNSGELGTRVAAQETSAAFLDQNN